MLNCWNNEGQHFFIRVYKSFYSFIRNLCLTVEIMKGVYKSFYSFIRVLNCWNNEGQHFFIRVYKSFYSFIGVTVEIMKDNTSL